MKLIVVIDDEILPEEAEKLEDSLAKFLGRKLKGRIEDELTGNTTVFPIVPDWTNIKIEEKLIERLRTAFSENGLDVPETDEAWTVTINSLLSEKITDDYGDNP